jgi:hypothetical protein
MLFCAREYPRARRFSDPIRTGRFRSVPAVCDTGCLVYRNITLICPWEEEKDVFISSVVRRSLQFIVSLDTVMYARIDRDV